MTHMQGDAVLFVEARDYLDHGLRHHCDVQLPLALDRGPHLAAEPLPWRADGPAGPSGAGQTRPALATD
jgi:hypothetical protein